MIAFNLIIGILVLYGCFSAKRINGNSNKFSIDSVKRGKEKIGDADSSLLIKKNKGKVSILFTEIFNDTLIMTQNRKFIKKWFMTSDSMKSVGYVPFDTTLNVGTKSIIDIFLLRQKKKISFFLDDSYPFVTIQRYNEVWYVNDRYYVMISK